MKRLISLLALIAFVCALNAQSKVFQRQEKLYMNGDYRQAAIQYEALAKSAEKAKKAPPYDVNFVYVRLGECFLFLKEFAKSDAYFTKAYERGVKDTAFLIDYGDALLANGKIEKALTIYQQCSTINPSSARALDRIQRVEYNTRSTNDPNAKLMELNFEKLNTISNSQYSLAWYKSSLLFSSDRAKPKGSDKVAPTHFYYAEAIYDFQQDKVGAWNPLQEFKAIKTPAPDYSFAYDIHTTTAYVARCFTSAKGKHCNIYAYQADKNGKMSKPMSQTFHDEKADIGHPTLSSDGKVMFFTYTKDQKSNIFMTKKIGNHMWTTPEKVGPVINTENGKECYPQLYRDSLLFFASNGHIGMGGLDIFYTKITMDGVGHAVNGNSDLAKLEFSTPVNLEAPINSGADDFSLLMRQDGRGGFLISNRTITTNNAPRNKGDIYGFSQEPYVFNAPGKYLVARLPCGSASSPMTYTATYTPSKTDTVYVEKIVEKLIGGGADQAVLQQNQAALQQSQAALLQKDGQITKLQQDLTNTQNLLLACQTQTPTQPAQPVQQPVAAQQPPTPVAQPQPTTQPVQPQQQPQQAQTQNVQPTTPVAPATTTPAPAPKPQPIRTVPADYPGLTYRVQVAASMSPVNFAEKFADLHQALPYLRMETLQGSDGYTRYLTIPYTTFAEADAIRNRIKALNFDCFIGTYDGNQRVSITVR